LLLCSSNSPRDVQAGYREGITAGKEEALQEGFDYGFETYGVPIGREIGMLRGLASALLIFLSREDKDNHPSPPDARQKGSPTGVPEAERPEEQVQVWLGSTNIRTEVAEIVRALANVRLVSLIPPDVEAIEHAKEHAGGDEGLGKLVGLDPAEERDRKVQEVEILKTRLKRVLQDLGLDIAL
jgi:Essential protein Yae1, N terminal